MITLWVVVYNIVVCDSWSIYLFMHLGAYLQRAQSNTPTMHIEAIGRFPASQSSHQVSVVGSVSINYARRQLMSSIISDICNDTQGYSVCTASHTPIDPPLSQGRTLTSFFSLRSCKIGLRVVLIVFIIE